MAWEYKELEDGGTPPRGRDYVDENRSIVVIGDTAWDTYVNDGKQNSGDAFSPGAGEYDDSSSAIADDMHGRNEKGNKLNQSHSKFQDYRPDVRFKVVGGYDDGEDFVAFKHSQPSVSVTTAANFTEHDVLGDVTVRQKLGEKPDEISVEGTCTKEEADRVDKLVYAEVVELVSSRWSGVVHVASTSTNPISDGGGMDLDGEWVYSFTVECVEVTENYEGEDMVEFLTLTDSETTFEEIS